MAACIITWKIVRDDTFDDFHTIFAKNRYSGDDTKKTISIVLVHDPHHQIRTQLNPKSLFSISNVF